MYFKSKTVSFVLLGITALLCSRAMFKFFNDPEGPNLLIVTVLALVIYLVPLAPYVSKQLFPSLRGFSRLLAMIGLQIGIVTILYFIGR